MIDAELRRLPHLLHLPSYFEKCHLGDVVSRFGSAGKIQHTLTSSFLKAILVCAVTAGDGRTNYPCGETASQKQRVLLARALYKRPKILFLDEATSHLDITREHMVNTAVNSLNITRVIVAHRPETIQSTDRVIALMNGRIVEDVLISKATSASTPAYAVFA